jgi:general secretion pathway protein F
MPLYAYKAMNPAGQNITGNLSAGNRSAALDQLSRDGLVVISVDEIHAAAVVHKQHHKHIGKVSQALSESFVRELSNLLAGGVPLSKAMNILSREASHAAAKRQWSAIHDDVVGGLSLADAMARWPKSFAPVQVAMVRAGETGGFLDLVLAQIADLRTRERDLKSKLVGALIYPAVLAVFSVVVVTILLTFFIPKFSGIFADFGAALPALTQGIIAASNIMTKYGLVVLGVVMVLILIISREVRSQSGRRRMERVLLQVPALGVVLSRFALVRFCRMLGTLLGAGVSLVTSLKVSREAIGNQTLADAMNASIEEVQRGKSLARSLAACPLLFPPSIIEVIAVAEESARLDKELIRLAASNENDMDRRLRVLVTLAEPAMLLLMAALVGTIVIGMLLPVFTLQDYIH